jgi:hypothetical protein
MIKEQANADQERLSDKARLLLSLQRDALCFRTQLNKSELSSQLLL